MADQPEPSEQEVDQDTTTEHSGEDSRKDEFGGRKGPEPTRYGDWEKNGRCIDF